jgi:16S rRNA (cytidine1402-2'-O)-methyltransferase
MPVVYLIPSLLAEDGMKAIPPYITESIQRCHVFFAENERTTRRYFKQLWKTYLPGQEMVIDDYEWHTIGDDSVEILRTRLKEGKNIGIISEAGLPGIADPGQSLVAIAQEMEAELRPLSGPGSIFLALMASGMNGQHFRFAGYLPIDQGQRAHAIRELETESAARNCTQIFIETPYRNNQLIETIVKTCKPATRLCIAADITGKDEWIKTMTITGWQKNRPELHKRPAIFLLYAGK